MAVPDFTLYFWLFVLRPSPGLILSPLSLGPKLESKIIQAWTLQDVLFSNIFKKQCKLHLGSIISHFVSVIYPVNGTRFLRYSIIMQF